MGFDLEHAINEFEDELDNDESTHCSIFLDITTEPQTMTQLELDYICRLYRISSFVDPCLIASGEDPTHPSAAAVVVFERFFDCGLSIPYQHHSKRSLVALR